MQAPSRPAASAASVARSVGGALGGRRHLDVPRLQRAAFSELIRHVDTDRSGRVSVPARAIILLHPEDRHRLEGAEGWFCSELAEALLHAARDNRWDAPAPPVITVESDASRTQGAPGVRVRRLAAPAPADAPAHAAPSPATGAARSGADLREGLLTRKDGPVGQTHRLAGDAVTIGRGPDRDIRLEEARASRNHGVFRPRRSAPGWTYTDAGSSNGTRINGHLVEPHQRIEVRDGDQVEIGSVRFEFSTLSPPPAPAPKPPAVDEPRTELLDDRQRAELTGVYFPPDAGAEADDGPGR